MGERATFMWPDGGTPSPGGRVTLEGREVGTVRRVFANEALPGHLNVEVEVTDPDAIALISGDPRDFGLGGSSGDAH